MTDSGVIEHLTTYDYAYKPNREPYKDGAHKFSCGTLVWFKNGRKHREDGPCAIRPDGYEYWGINGRWHREDGPALTHNGKIRSQGDCWWFKGELCESINDYIAVNDELDDEDATLLKLKWG